MRRAASLLSVVGIASALMLVGVPAADAVEPPPPPVTPATGLPSWQGVYYNPDGLTPGTPAYDDWLARMKARVPPPVNNLMPSSTVPGGGGPGGGPPKLITAPSVVGRVVGGVGLGLGFLVGWGIGTGGLHAIGQATGTDPYAAMCGTGTDWYDDAHKLLNFGVGPECAIPQNQTKANDDVLAHMLTVGNFSVQYKGTDYVGRPCWAKVGTLSVPAAPNNWFVSDPTVTTGVMPGYRSSILSSTVSSCSSVYGANAGYYTPGPGPASVVANGSTGAIVATSSKPDPSRLLGCQITWSDGTTTNGIGQSYQETGAIPFNVAGTGCDDAYAGKIGAGPGGIMPTRIRVHSSSTQGGTAHDVSNQKVGTPDAAQTSALQNGSAGGLVLSKVIDGVATSCMTWQANCAQWWTFTQSGTVPAVGPTSYRCTFGGNEVSLSECGIYRFTFDTRTSTPTVTDPVTGDQEQWVTAPATGTDPGNPNAPGSDPANANSTNPATSISPGDACFESWPAFELADPITWVMHPVYCAIVKAFAPRQAVVDAKFAEAETVWSTKAPAALIAAAGQIDGMTGPTGCSIPITILGVTADVINVCDGMMAQLPIYTRLITGAYAVIIVYTKLREQSAAMVNYNVGQT